MYIVLQPFKKKISTGLALQTFTTNNHQQCKTQVN